MSRILIENGTIVNEGRMFKGSVLIDGDRITDIIPTSPITHYPSPILGSNNHSAPQPPILGGNTIDATGALVLPGVIDSHVHFREPGLTDKADIESESCAAAYGGVTSFFDMPNTVPQTTTLEALDAKFLLAKEKSHVNYSFFFGATNNNYTLFQQLDRHRIPGIKLFMGSSTGNMLVDRYGSLLKIFETAAQLDLPIMAHCEDTDTIQRNMAAFQKSYSDDPPVQLHPLIRSEDACFESSALAVQLARQFGTHLHIAHVSTAKELELIEERGERREERDRKEERGKRKEERGERRERGVVTLEACIAHLLFSSADYNGKGALIKCNPAVKRLEDREALRAALNDGRISTIATDHAPHLLSQKQGGCRKAASGMPMIQFSLPVMLGLASKGVLPVERVVDLMCHQPARLFRVSQRGFLRPGYKADIAIVRPVEPYTVTQDIIQSKCQWSPLEGDTLSWRVTHTLCNGHFVLAEGRFDTSSRGEEICFR